ncbi:MAG: DUF362 domain-containing protein [Candidatus Omnitrophota bacterium]
MVNVAVVQCTEYDPEKVLRAVRRSIDLLGGMDRFVKSGQKVFIKPNLLSARKPEEGVDTHPSVVRAVVKLVKEAGAKAMIGDSPGGFIDNEYIDKVFEVSGMKALAKEERVDCARLTESVSVKGYPISKLILESDLIISVPKFKTHDLMTLTLGVKNLYGAVTGPHKVHLHLGAPKPEDFANIVVDIFEIAKPALTILDGIVAMEGGGPAAGPLKKMGCIASSADAVALDAVISSMVGLKPLDVPSTKAAFERGLGEADINKIKVVGDGLKEFSGKNFKLPTVQLLKRAPRALSKILVSLVKFYPDIGQQLCKKCGMCEKSCPAKAISVKNKQYVIDRSLCIKCFCCREVCRYNAIDLKKNIFAKMLF